MKLGEWIYFLRKGLIAIAAGLGQLGLALSDISHGGSAITGAEWVQIALAGLGALGVVAVSNGPRPGSSTEPDDDGYTGKHEA